MLERTSGHVASREGGLAPQMSRRMFSHGQQRGLNMDMIHLFERLCNKSVAPT